jgi:hypothetical protein
MKIAIFHDYFGAIGGGERVVLEMAKILNADIITTDTDAVTKIDPSVHVISIGKTVKMACGERSLLRPVNTNGVNPNPKNKSHC